MLRLGVPSNSTRHSRKIQLHGKIQAGLSADAGDDGIRPLIADDAGNVFQRQRFHIDLIRNGRVCHDGGGIGIAEDDLISLLF